MNVIVIFLDSFRQDHLSIYNQGNAPFPNIPACNTPNLDKFAKQCVIFENAYPEALPTIPVRCQLMTGQRTLPFRPWEPLTSQDITLTEILRKQGYICGLISDTYHYRAPGMNYHANFHEYRWIRGQEYDPYVSSPPKRDVENYVNEHYTDKWKNRIKQFLANTDDFTSAEDWFPAKVVKESVRWLKDNRSHDKVFLWIDSFDPHEPWDPIEEFDTYTDPDYEGSRLIMPMGGIADHWARDHEIEYIQGLYAGEASFVDHCLGELFENLQELGYYEDSIIILLADHGHPLCDHMKFLKGSDRMYSELLKVPYLIHLPGGKNAGMRTDAIIQFHDTLPTILELLDSSCVSGTHGESFVPVLYGDTDEHRQAMITGYYQGIDRCIRDKTWSYIQRPEDEPDELYNLQKDPRETKNLIDKHTEEAKRLSAMFGDYFRQIPAKVIKGVQETYEMVSGSVE
ncbi:sulfatase-like hydrolase/transferase [Candidatus Poribacteria bacterium]|nr:sulfatase-like hydrolase/transferase [Candidatus Poribacteria bacterium]